MLQGSKLQENNHINLRPNEKQFVYIFTFSNADDSEIIYACDLAAVLKGMAHFSTENEN